MLTLSAGQFASTLQKAKDKLKERRASGKVPRSSNKMIEWEESYGIQRGQEMSEEHVVAIMLYTNFSELCYLFSATYRKVHEYEDDEDMMARHKEYAIWGRLLREAVECFGTSMRESAVNMFYHGVSARGQRHSGVRLYNDQVVRPRVHYLEYVHCTIPVLYIFIEVFTVFMVLQVSTWRARYLDQEDWF